MSKYYYLIAGLPNLSLDDSKIPFSVDEFRAELGITLTPKDKKMFDLFFLKQDNQNLLNLLLHPERGREARGELTDFDYKEVITALRDEEPLPKHVLPTYMITFLQDYLAEENKETEAAKNISWEDRLAGLYYAYAMKNSNRFIAEWYELNLNINNVLTAITARKYDLDKSLYIVGNNEIAQTLRTSNSRDFGLGDSVDYLGDLQRITEETDLLMREKKLDQLKWNWLEEQTFFKTFDVESVFAYMLKLEMIERWTTLDKIAGEKTFRELIGGMKKGSDSALEEFKKNNTK
ncbi:DUF2764 domain-containing protein [Parabacteroides sp. 52]|uniref:DUF2764 family protein n=1 Tax=unclassified Parabacteroides TaxID=2649774 RepID=UPI0013D575EB|nr:MULTISPECIES: DUF2764 family protein [unclassified Parabacteroides]MDH6533803.1 hypothetical protein [Parabacteroides sp. PM5-20]NDV54553.1 DUF2764 domain-containing protein [Parabacteroides sp. 52]